MKSLANTMLGIVTCILKDTASHFPSMTTGLELDRSRLESLTEKHGESLFTLLLPALCDWFHQSLEQGHLPAERPFLSGKKSNQDDRPTFLWDLYSVLFDSSGTLRADSDPAAVFFIRQILLPCKKWKMDCPQEKVDETLAEFLRIEASLPPSFECTWDDDHPKWMRRTGHPLYGTRVGEPDLFGLPDDLLPRPYWERLDGFCRRVVSQFGYLDVYSISPKHGPGIVADKARIKYEFDHWPRKLGAWFAPDFFASHDYHDRTKGEREFPSRIAAVPKTQKGPRLICSEPTAHQWIQGGLQRWLEQAISRTDLRHAISLHDQEPSRRLALIASQDASLATIDLSSASDRLTTRLVEYVLQGNHSLLNALHACRSRIFVTPTGVFGKFKKFAPQGSACTFPVQSIVFTLLAAFAVSEVKGISPEHALRMVRVFGDDIIVPNDSYEEVTRLLETCGLKVNRSKSFTKGFFRESCGMDAYKGVDVTPAYARSGYDPRNPETLASVVECSNNFHKKGLWHTADYLLKTIDRNELKLIPITDRALGSCSAFTFCKGASVASLRWNPFLHREEVLILDVSPKGTSKIKGAGEASLLQFFIEAPHPSSYVKWESGQAKRPLLRKQKRWVQLP